MDQPPLPIEKLARKPRTPTLEPWQLQQTYYNCTANSAEDSVKVIVYVNTYQEEFVDVNFSILVDVNFTQNFMKLTLRYVLSSFLTNITSDQSCSFGLHYFVIDKNTYRLHERWVPDSSTELMLAQYQVGL